VLIEARGGLTSLTPNIASILLADAATLVPFQRIVSFMLRRSHFLACFVAFLTACGSDGPPVSQREREIGAEHHPQLLAHFGGAYAGGEAGYLDRLGQKVATAADLEGQCTFTLVNTDVVNAFAVPGCYIYVTRGLMGIVNSEAELASVLAHELGHIAANHSERQQRRALFRGLGVAAIEALSGSERLSRIAQQAAGLFTLRYSRKHEYEADELGLTYLANAGYDPGAAVGMLGALGRHQQFVAATRGRDESGSSIPEWALTHPLTENRIARARAAADAPTASDADLPDNKLEYLREVDGLLYGDDPAQGFVMGRRFAHPVMRIGFEAPPGFTLTNSPQAIMIEGPDGLQGEFSGGPLPSAGLRAYAEGLLSNMLRDVPAERGPVRRIEVNDVPAVRLDALVRTGQGAVAVSLAAYQGAENYAYHFLIVSRPGTAPAETIGALFSSFRMLTPAEAAGLRPRRIRTLLVGPGDKIRTLAARMAADEPLAHFLMLNGRSADEELKPGEIVKLVVTTPR
jgi:predicted Zn-dependent protease